MARNQRGGAKPKPVVQTRAPQPAAPAPRGQNAAVAIIDDPDSDPDGFGEDDDVVILDDGDGAVAELEETPDSFDEVQQYSATPAGMATTNNFLAPSEPEVVDEVTDVGVTVVDGVRTFVVRTVEDIGPIYYGDDLIEMKKGRRYRVSEAIRDFLRIRSLLWEQQ